MRRLDLTIVAVVLCLLSAGLLAPPAQAASKAADTYGALAVTATNVQRVAHDRAKLKRNACLQKFANRQARKMAKKEKIWHQDLNAVLDACDMNYVGENVAAGYSSGTSVVTKGWMKSEGHRENILRKQFKKVAVAARKGDDGRWYAAQVFGRKAR